ncbi:protein translocase subunit SecD [Candidatus Kinetoplastidibacterium crithidiae]|uniref:Protein translocase subunit SecD n=1 Tax=Candidatus Kinetoplastidibacterium crithidiae TCC036E TaxID=1208918 RepID=M1M5G9_9PROT|nr:protein translocase subunit SecD [Candidatus Kinetoplastibacterium crithidii]AGF47415.1 preprotein translocase subunit SecD [Candidatus Kinetoplastibacterium crithidii TCC036E]
MNCYPRWKNILIILTVFIGILYFIPNLYGVSPSIQIRSVKKNIQVDDLLAAKIEAAIKQVNIPYKKCSLVKKGDSSIIDILLLYPDDQIISTSIIENLLNNTYASNPYIVTPNIVSNIPKWMLKLGPFTPKPIVLGLDLRGGIHILIKVDIDKAISSNYDNLLMDIKAITKKHKLDVRKIYNDSKSIRISLANNHDINELNKKIKSSVDGIITNIIGNQLECKFEPSKISEIKKRAIQQNLLTLNNRINALGVSEPVIQQQGSDEIIVQLPGLQDIMKAKEILGRTATIEFRLVDDSKSTQLSLSQGIIPIGKELFCDKHNNRIAVHAHPIINSANIYNAQPGRDPQTGQPSVNLTLDNKGARIFKDVTRDNINKRLAILIYEEGKGEIITAPIIRSEIPNGNIQITGSMNYQEAADISLILRSGLLSAPMNIIEEKIIGPSLGSSNIDKGMKSIFYGFSAIVIFMTLYYQIFGIFASIGLALNIVLLISALSILQATITLPGIAAIALTIGISIDANVLINERIREELRNESNSPKKSIEDGFEKAWNTILDSNLTTFIVGLSLLILGSGSIRGFAVVHCIGILSSIFSSVIFVKFLINLFYGSKKNIKKIYIGQIWKPRSLD